MIIDDKRKHTSYDNLTAVEGVAVFKECLADMGVSASWKWEDANREA